MTKSFRYYAEPNEIRKYVEELGYRVENMYNHTHDEVVGFSVSDTAVRLSYSLKEDDRAIGWGTVSVRPSLSGLEVTETDREITEQSEKLYRQLKRRFGSRFAKRKR